jgi:hypothetical protein
MTRMQAFLEAARRDGESAEQIERKFMLVRAMGVIPPDADEEIPAGQEEAFIEAQLRLKRKVERAIRQRTRCCGSCAGKRRSRTDP